MPAIVFQPRPGEQVFDHLEWERRPGSTVEIVDVAVNSGRRRGQGRRLVGALLARLPAGTRLVYAVARAENGIAADFYAALGFRVVGRLDRFYRDDRPGDAVVYGLDVGGAG